MNPIVVKSRFTKRNRILIMWLCATVVALAACKKDKLTPQCDGSDPSWNNGINTLISANCNGGNCHHSGSSKGDFTTYTGILPYLNNGEFSRRVLDKQNMPQGDVLTQDEINRFQCWADSGFPEN